MLFMSDEMAVRRVFTALFEWRNNAPLPSQNCFPGACPLECNGTVIIKCSKKNAHELSRERGPSKFRLCFTSRSRTFINDGNEKVNYGEPLKIIKSYDCAPR